jgi:hypothetical protein
MSYKPGKLALDILGSLPPSSSESGRRIYELLVWMTRRDYGILETLEVEGYVEVVSSAPITLRRTVKGDAVVSGGYPESKPVQNPWDDIEDAKIGDLIRVPGKSGIWRVISSDDYVRLGGNPDHYSVKYPDSSYIHVVNTSTGEAQYIYYGYKGIRKCKIIGQATETTKLASDLVDQSTRSLLRR